MFKPRRTEPLSRCATTIAVRPSTSRRHLAIGSAGFVVVVDPGEEVGEALVAFAEEYVRNPVDEETEVLSLVGYIGRDSDGALALHAHVVLDLRDGTTRGVTCSAPPSAPRSW
ncbi:hypothetical protein [Lentzea sp.]|uniref:hypothetical protein n=1 Tax=Lentzea sp. TaxID=56099 RepID=UPI002C76424C|nr:hypothetical protein [Lentzea sp.]HUQ56728.1 hypothetical protein [Lentzea sp.]